ncbi:MAG: hypothetical protein ACM3SS_20495 [Rhodospirillaceae bacterium]
MSSLVAVLPLPLLPATLPPGLVFGRLPVVTPDALGGLLPLDVEADDEPLASPA